ncbi:MAG: biopolymer transporter ExbD [Veillonella sp.]|jgi:transport energizing protein, exbD/tolR family|uniref:ExbD/TolR family protein n=1 Tax=Veillonella sp. TaxID=1926307 RepID=UPI00290F47FE|nr:biopolymer transporter ExbD [Veillonella sp.]MBD9034438.1 biopolymer transporter ExbD [Veillonella atypica]MDU5731827.1 biopolymer transporter ExbD [Veillonella sp.]MDU8949216.1 biopolymer transporter ExbD [Veillonella sp.]
MRRRTLGVKKEPTIMIIPMIDIVFFLLVFFMVGTLYMNTEQQIPLNLPSTSTSTAKSIEPIIITLTTSHKLYIDNREISADNLSQEVQDIVRTAPRQAFVIRASKDVYYNEVIALLDMLKVNGAKYISVATDRK